MADLSAAGRALRRGDSAAGALLGAVGGRARTFIKALAARINGEAGGRPRGSSRRLGFVGARGHGHRGGKQRRREGQRSPPRR